MPADLLQGAREAVDALRDGSLAPAQASRRLRDQTELLAALPPRFGEVLAGLLDRLESSALFDGESCSFSQRDLHEALQAWVQHAQTRLSSDA